MAHIGQKLTFGGRCRLCRFSGIHQFADVNAKTHGVAIGQTALHNAQRRAVGVAFNKI